MGRRTTRSRGQVFSTAGRAWSGSQTATCPRRTAVHLLFQFRWAGWAAFPPQGHAYLARGRPMKATHAPEAERPPHMSHQGLSKGAGMGKGASTRVAQGLSPFIEEAAVYRRLAAIMLPRPSRSGARAGRGKPILDTPPPSTTFSRRAS